MAVTRGVSAGAARGTVLEQAGGHVGNVCVPVFN